MVWFLNWGYVAGFLDADGNIGLLWRRKKIVEPYVRMVNTNKEALEKIRLFLGLGYITVNCGNQKRLKWRPTYVLSIQARKDVITLIKNCLPHLIIKKAQAEIMLRFCEIRIRKWKLHEVKGTTGATSFGREELMCYKEIKKLNFDKGKKKHYKQIDVDAVLSGMK